MRALSIADSERIFGQNAMLCCQPIKHAHAVEALFIQVIGDIFRQVGADGVLAEGQAGAPLGDEGFDVGEAAVA